MELININDITGRKVYRKLCARVIRQAINDSRKINDIGKPIFVSDTNEKDAKKFIQQLGDSIYSTILGFDEREIVGIKNAAEVKDTDVIITKDEKKLYELQCRSKKLGRVRHWCNDGIHNKIADTLPEGWKWGKCGAYCNQYSKGICGAKK